MPGRLFDLNQSGIQLPSLLVVDTNLVAARLLAPFYPPHIQTAERTYRFFSQVRTQGAVGMMPTVVCQEFFHLALRGLFERAMSSYRATLAAVPAARRRFNWEDLYKHRPDLISEFLPQLETMRSLFEIDRLAVIQPWEISPLPVEHRFEAALLRAMGRYQINTNDAAILLEAQRAGITSIATLDADMRRAQIDYDVYTWL